MIGGDLTADPGTGDLDIELVMKLVRKGYLPLEIPVNYTSRSFAEGKKVSFTRDAMTWVGTILRYRLDAIGRGRGGTTGSRSSASRSSGRPRARAAPGRG